MTHVPPVEEHASDYHRSKAYAERLQDNHHNIGLTTAMARPSPRIAGVQTGDHWRATKQSLIVGGDPAPWRRAFDDFFRTRLQLRYLAPIKVLEDSGEFTGEGFSIAVIQCSLVEYLESTLQGLKYRHLDPDNHAVLGPFEYSSSAKLFTTFLTTREPFKRDFTKKIASDFYFNVRCALFHEARTTNGWVIRVGDPAGRIIDPQGKILFRDSFQVGLLAFVESFGEQLLTSVKLQNAFILKWDDLAES